ncbi:hypothetical protein OS493_025739 [Desmophyllum pertusum]|uniref:Uncharacterized protein n=1 Tax=Desmophyllum pertusum TaxID=174260 RepID=A0A9X0D316_9CNID|nr:hypothetical protein OS493_025739 [Desmophyllum pertusum]
MVWEICKEPGLLWSAPLCSITHYDVVFTGGILGASPYALGGIPSGLPIVSAVPSASTLDGSSHYVSSRYVVGNQAAIIHGYTGLAVGSYVGSKGVSPQLDGVL